MMDPDIVGALKDIVDPELGIGIVDLGLVYRAAHTPAGVEVIMTMTSPSCPMSEVLVAQVHGALRRRFPDSVHDVQLTWEPPWSPARITAAGCAQLGWRKTARADAARSSWPARLLKSLVRH